MRREGFRWPRSTRLTYVRSNPALAANASWESLSAILDSRTLCPNCRSATRRSLVSTATLHAGSPEDSSSTDNESHSDRIVALGRTPKKPNTTDSRTLRMASCNSCGKKRPFVEVMPWKWVEGSLFCDECANRLENEKRDPIRAARAAFEQGEPLFQLALPLSETTGVSVGMVGAFSTTSTTEHGSLLSGIESAGWSLEHAAYVYRVKGSVSRDKLLSSGQEEAMHGEIVGVYIFRRRDSEQCAAALTPGSAESDPVGRSTSSRALRSEGASNE